MDAVKKVGKGKESEIELIWKCAALNEWNKRNKSIICFQYFAKKTAAVCCLLIEEKTASISAEKIKALKYAKRNDLKTN